MESNDDLYNKISELIEFQLSLHFDSYTSKKQWNDLLASADLNQIAEALANNLHCAGLDVVTARRILNK
ncbi:hypothetical protein [Providencia sp. PROV092]|uniref:hypothetical protein n=1 Tax=Providencia sp. PROV092 TaxID=2949808 RepID=UPI0023497537|nr:hypothetical protein [Providencia sp. PROV092]